MYWRSHCFCSKFYLIKTIPMVYLFSFLSRVLNIYDFLSSVQWCFNFTRITQCKWLKENIIRFIILAIILDISHELNICYLYHPKTVYIAVSLSIVYWILKWISTNMQISVTLVMSLIQFANIYAQDLKSASYLSFNGLKTQRRKCSINQLHKLFRVTWNSD